MTNLHSGSIKVQLQRWKGAECQFWRVHVVYSYALSAHKHIESLVSHVNFYRDINRHGHCHWLIYHISIRSFKVLYSVLVYFNLSFYIRIFYSFFLSLMYMCVNILYRGMKQCNVVAVFECLLFNSTTFYPCSLLSHINASACMSLLCLTEGIKVKWKHLEPPPSMGPSIFRIYRCVEKSGLFFRSYRKGCYARPHRSERSQSSMWAIFLSSERIKAVSAAT